MANNAVRVAVFLAALGGGPAAGKCLPARSTEGAGQKPTTAEQPPKDKAKLPEKKDQQASTEAADDRWSKLGFGLGIGVSHLGGASDILETRIDSRTLRITDSEDVKRGVWLETHYLLDKYASRWRYLSHGPFVAVQAGATNSVFNAVASGYMLSLKRTPKSDSNSKAAFNIGLGLHTTKISALASGLADGQPLPDGVEEARLRKSTKNGLVLIFTFSVF